jgi:hypothetical protein
LSIKGDYTWHAYFDGTDQYQKTDTKLLLTPRQNPTRLTLQTSTTQAKASDTVTITGTLLRWNANTLSFDVGLDAKIVFVDNLVVSTPGGDFKYPVQTDGSGNYNMNQLLAYSGVTLKPGDTITFSSTWQGDDYTLPATSTNQVVVTIVS